jgi:serine/threonine protein kinase
VLVDLAEGAVIAGTYQIVRLIGRGGMGEVYLARHLTLGKLCALKAIPPDQLTDVGWHRFQIEARLFSSLDHINLVRVSDLGIHEGCLPFYAMDYIDGQTLSDLVAQNGPLPVKEAVEIFSQVCDGLEVAHRHGIIHRDLKPANIMISRSRSGASTVKILDFGLAKLTQQDREKQSLTAVGEVFGSPYYMSPEQCSGEKIDNRADIYSIGCTMFECLTERPPFSGNLALAIINGHQFSPPPTLESIVGPGVFPESLELVMAKLLRKNPTERYQTMAELKGDLQRVGQGQSVQPYYASRTRSRSSVADTDSQSSAQSAGQEATVLDNRSAGKSVNQPLRPSGARDKRITVIMAAGGVAALLAAGSVIANLVLQHPRKQAEGNIDKPAQPSVTQHASRAAADAELTYSARAFYQGIVQHSGKLWKRWEFPANIGPTLGYMRIVDEDFRASIMDDEPEDRRYFDPDGAMPLEEKAMSDRVEAPRATRIIVKLQGSALTMPQVLPGFSQDNIDGIIVSDLQKTDFDALSKIYKNFQKAYYLRLAGNDPDMCSQARAIDFVNQFPRLTMLNIDTIKDGRSLSQIVRLKALRHLVLSGVQSNYDDLFAALDGSRPLEELKLVDIPISARAMDHLLSCHNLVELSFPGGKKQIIIRPDQVLSLARLERLKILSLTCGKQVYSQALVESLGKLKGLTELRLTTASPWTASQQRDLQRRLQRTEIWLTALTSKDSEPHTIDLLPLQKLSP